MNVRKLLAWYLEYARDLPWRKYPTPYNVWVSEIILQQTQMSRGVEYYKKFIEEFPDVFALSNADEQDVLRLWQGLGYYSRARNLHCAAKYIVQNHQGVFPEDIAELKKIKGIGDYTASAIASIAFDSKAVVADGNVIRVISRLFYIQEPVDIVLTIKTIKAHAFLLMGDHRPSLFNQAMMELGALVCKPVNPACSSCPMIDQCKAFASDAQMTIPVKSKKIKRSERYFHYFFINDSAGSFYLKQRTNDDIWKQLWELPLIETEAEIKLDVGDLAEFLPLNKITIANPSFIARKLHKLTHRDIHASFYRIDVHGLLNETEGFVIVTQEQRRAYPVHNLMKWGFEVIIPQY